MSIFTDIGKTAANAATGGVVGTALDIAGNAIQRGQQQKLTADQIKAQKEMIDYNQKKQLEMWNATGYGAQMKQLKEAGLNPSLLYGSKGGGGITTGGGAPAITSGMAQKGNAAQSMAIGMDMQLQAAQIEAIKADAELKQAQAAKTAGVDTKESETRIASLTQGIENQKAQEALTRIDASWKSIQNFIADETVGESIESIRYNLRRSIQEVNALARENAIGEETKLSKISLLKNIAIGEGLRNILLKTQNLNEESKTRLNEKTISKMTNDMMLGWDQLNNAQKETRIRESMMEWTTSANREATQQTLDLINKILH